MTIRTAAPNKDRRSASKVLPARARPSRLPCPALACTACILTATLVHQARVALIFVRAHAPVIKIIKDRFLEMSFSLFEMTIIFLSLCFSEWRRSYSKLYIPSMYILFLSWLGRQASTENVSNFEKVFMCKADRKLEFLYIVASPLKPNYFKKQCSSSSFLLT